MVRPEENEEDATEDLTEEEDTSELEELEERLEEWEHKPRSPKMVKRKGTISGALGVIWLGFTIVWLFFFAADFTLFENIAIVLAALFILAGLTNALLWGPPEWRVRLSSVLGILWITFVVLWMPFYRNYGVLIYQGYAILILSFVITTLIIGGAWLPIVPKSNWKPSKGKVAGATVVFYTWLAILMLWFWFYADTFSLSRNWAIALLTTLISFLIVMGIMASEIPTGPSHRWTGTAIAIAWFVIIIAWLWFFADSFLPTQNIAVFLLVSLILGALGGYRGKSWFDELETFDWTD
ncbi:MAG: hypothetical protein ACFFAY_02795 [Promethearchaeota archaeon]